MNALTKAVSRPERCANHGDFEARRVIGEIWSRCPTCTAERESKEKTDQEQRERERALAAWGRRINEAGIPDRFKDRSLKSYVADSEGQQRALAFAEAYADGFDEALATGRSAVFIGKPGTGKTHLAAGIALQIMDRGGRSALFSTVMRTIRRIRNTWQRNAEESETEAVAAFTRPDLLILDEVGVQYGSADEKRLIFDIINERYEQRRPTLFLSNLALPDVCANLGERVYDRLREDGGEVVVFDWPSHRSRT